MSFAENLQYLRKRDKITQEELADNLSVSRQSVSKWETGEAWPETEKIIALCDIFGVTMDDLMRGDVAGGQNNQPADEEGAAEQASQKEAAKDEADHSIDIVWHSEEEQPYPDKRLAAIGGAVNGAIVMCAVISFFCIGGILGLWHPAWLVFPLAFSLCAFFDAVFARDDEKRLSPVGARIFRGLAGMMMLLSVTIYLFIGCVWGIWHPSWVIFIIAVVLIGAFDGIAKAICAGKQ